MSAYAHLGNFAVQERQTVQAGQTIGTVGADDNLSQPAVEFQIRYRGTPVNPASYLK
ncbi:M23 family metallopeptidase [Mycobacterium tuberculosis]|nr:M23 family metallopeptidase [Mycobacterium tuberculosis]